MSVANWRQGEHISILGTTGAGKSYLAYHLLPYRQYVVFCATKPRDSTITSFARKNRYERIKSWPPSPHTRNVLLWPSFNVPGDEIKQKLVFHRALLDIFVEGGWCTYIDEAYYFTKILGLERILNIYWTQARSNGISLLAATQRPRDVPLLMYDQATHLFFFRFRDKRDLDRLGDIGYLDSKAIKTAVSSLERYQFLYINNLTGDMAISKL